MAVKPVKVISIIGMMSELDKVVKLCGDSRMFHPDDAMSFYSNKQGFSPLSVKNPYSVSLQNLKAASVLAGFELCYKKPKGFNKSDDELLKYADDFCDKIDRLSNRKLQYKSRFEEIDRTIDQVKHFTGRGSFYMKNRFRDDPFLQFQNFILGHLRNFCFQHAPGHKSGTPTVSAPFIIIKPFSIFVFLTLIFSVN